MSNLTVRVISAVVLAVAGFSALVFNLQSRWALVALILALGTWEFSLMVGRKYPGPRIAWYCAALVGLFALPYFPGIGILEAGWMRGFVISDAEWIWGVVIFAAISLTLLGFRFVDIQAMAPWIYLNLFACVYFGIYCAAAFDLLKPFTGWEGIFPLLLLQVCVSAADIGAYAAGRTLGKRKLCPGISSKKTVEGAIGGTIAATALAMALGPSLLGAGWAFNLGLGLIVSVTSVMGDLFISALKRYADIKDSSQLIPGHGGVLDRFNSLFFSAPVAVFYLRVFGS